MRKSLLRIFADRMRSEGVLSAAKKGLSYFRMYGLRGMPKLSALQVEVTNSCNLECPGCARTIAVRNGRWNNRHMTVDQFRGLIQEVPAAWYLSAHGVGEPTLHPDLPQLIKIAHESGKFGIIRINSNVLVRDVPYYEKLFRSGLTSLDVSVDALDQAIADRVRTGTSVRVLEDRLSRLGRCFPGKIGVGITVRAENLEHIPDLLARLNELGRFTIGVQPFCDYGYPPGCLSLQERQKLAINLAKLVGKFKNLSAPDLGRILPSREVCTAPWDAPAITADGYLAPCCVLMAQEDVRFGNVFEAPFNDVWGSSIFEEFRRTMERQSPPECKPCGFFEVR